MSSSSEFRRILRRLNSSKRAPQPRPRSELSFYQNTSALPKLLLDTTVYVDELQGGMRPEMQVALQAASIWHSTVTECELATLAGVLDPNHPGTANASDRVLASIENRPDHRIVTPDREVWRDAGILAGVLARLQQYGRAEHRRVLNDALIFMSAAREGLTVLTRNVSDFDLLMQLTALDKVVFYERK